MPDGHFVPAVDDACPQCGNVVGDHTIRGWTACLDAAGFNYTLPYAEVPDGPLRFDTMAEGQIMVGELTIKAGAAETPLGNLPIIVFTFYGPGLEPMSRVATPDYVLIGDVGFMHNVKAMIAENIDAAIAGVT